MFVFLGKSLQVAMQRAPNLLSHLQQQAGEESAPTGASQKLLGCSYAKLCSKHSLMETSQFFLISTASLYKEAEWA